MIFPTDVFSKINVELTSDTRAPDQRLFRYRSRGILAPYYTISLTTPPLEYEQGVGVAAMLDGFQNELEIFDLPNPIPSVKVHSGLTLAQAASEDDRQIVVQGLSPSQQNAVAAGDFIQIGGDKKAYRIMMSADSDGTGQATVTLTQNLLADYALSSAIKYGENVVFQVSMVDRGSATIDADMRNLMVHDVELIEQL